MKYIRIKNMSRKLVKGNEEFKTIGENDEPVKIIAIVKIVAIVTSKTI